MTKAIKHRTRKNFAGNYTRTDGINEVRVYSDVWNEDFGTEWIAVTCWDNDPSDPVHTKWRAIEVADWCLTERRKEMGL